MFLAVGISAAFLALAAAFGRSRKAAPAPGPVGPVAPPVEAPPAAAPPAEPPPAEAPPAGPDAALAAIQAEAEARERAAAEAQQRAAADAAAAAAEAARLAEQRAAAEAAAQADAAARLAEAQAAAEALAARRAALARALEIGTRTDPPPTAAELLEAAAIADSAGWTGTADMLRDRAAAAAAAEGMAARLAETPMPEGEETEEEEAERVFGPETPEEAQEVEERVQAAAEAAPSLPGYDPAKARELAPLVARSLARLGTGTRNDRSRRQTAVSLGLLQDFGRAAFGDAVVDEEIARTGYWGFGGRTRGALIFYGVANPPAPLIPPLGTVAYTPPEA